MSFDLFLDFALVTCHVSLSSILVFLYFVILSQYVIVLFTNKPVSTQTNLFVSGLLNLKGGLLGLSDWLKKWWAINKDNYILCFIPIRNTKVICHDLVMRYCFLLFLKRGGGVGHRLPGPGPLYISISSLGRGSVCFALLVPSLGNFSLGWL